MFYTVGNTTGQKQRNATVNGNGSGTTGRGTAPTGLGYCYGSGCESEHQSRQQAVKQK
ncbi:hypothetical protein GCM10023185_38080 [Hymenobacter saemangeumensis]|uniref:Uncharacterized protein n=1 Tax=Hymenobacter saemangeumensis TaxID=1084522 RepID=A0ABP8IQE5_9BACT